MDLKHWMNDGLMTIFFLVVGLEIKREATTGHLASREKLTLPLVAALGGMMVPAGIYLAIAGSTASHGWGVPMATDIALALGLLSTVGSQLPSNLRAYLLGLAVVDDIAAIVVIAIFYSTGVSGKWLGVALAVTLITYLFKKTGIQFLPLYILCGVVLWYALHEAGVHATIAGVILGLLIPLTPHQEHKLHPWSAFLIVPLFALANAGVQISSSSLSDALSSRIAWGVFTGLVLGKPIGVFIASLVATKTGLTQLPERSRKLHVLGVGQTAGIGFTVAIFISELAFTTQQHRTEAKMAILFASVTAALLGTLLLRRTHSES